jgi:hypothetical protein
MIKKPRRKPSRLDRGAGSLWRGYFPLRNAQAPEQTQSVRIYRSGVSVCALFPVLQTLIGEFAPDVKSGMGPDIWGCRSW